MEFKKTNIIGESPDAVRRQWIQRTVVRQAATPVLESLETRTLMFAPSGMSAEGTSASSVTLHWTDNASTETHFIVDRSVDGVHFKRIGSVPANSTSFPDTGLQPSTTYHYRVKAITTTLNSGWSRVTGSTLATSSSTAPEAPSDMTATSPVPTLMSVNWTDNADDETHFLLERSTDGVKFKRIASLGANTTEFLDGNVAPDTQYHYRIRSVNGVGGSKYVRASGTTTVETPPTAPSGFTANGTSMTTIDLAWSDNSNNELYFLIDRSTDGVNFVRRTSLTANATSFADTDLTPGTTYHYRIKAVNLTTGSSWVKTSGATEAPLIGEDFAGGSANFTPVDGNWEVLNGQYQLTGPDLSATAHLNNRVVHSTVIDGDLTLDVDASAGDAGTAWSDFAVIFGYQDPDNYYFFSSNQSNDTLTSGIYKVVNGVSTELADVTGGINVGQTYKLRVVRFGNLIEVSRDGVLLASANDATFMSGQVGFGAKSNTAAFDNLIVTGEAQPAPPPPSNPPSAPSGLTATTTSNSKITLHWTDNASDETGFKIERSTDGTTWTQVGTVGANVKTYGATGLSSSTTYYFRVRGYNVAGDSSFSNSASATTSAAPTGDTLGEYTRPTVNNTGPTNRSLITTTRSGTDLFTTHDGQIIENINFVGVGITFNHDNVIVRNCTFSGHPTPFYTSGGANGARRGIRIEDCDITWSGGTCVVGNGMSFYRNYIHGGRNNDWANNVRFATFESNYFTDIGLSSSSNGAHLDIYQWIGQTRMDLNITWRGNNFDFALTGALSEINAILMTVDMTAITFEYNWVKGGAYSLRIGAPSTDMKINHNFFEGWVFGPINFVTGGSNTWRNAIEFNGNQIYRNGSVQAFELPGVRNGDLFGLR